MFKVSVMKGILSLYSCNVMDFFPCATDRWRNGAAGSAQRIAREMSTEKTGERDGGVNKTGKNKGKTGVRGEYKCRGRC